LSLGLGKGAEGFEGKGGGGRGHTRGSKGERKEVRWTVRRWGKGEEANHSGGGGKEVRFAKNPEDESVSPLGKEKVVGGLAGSLRGCCAEGVKCKERKDFSHGGESSYFDKRGEGEEDVSIG